MTAAISCKNRGPGPDGVPRARGPLDPALGGTGGRGRRGGREIRGGRGLRKRRRRNEKGSRKKGRKKSRRKERSRMKWWTHVTRNAKIF